MQNEKIKLHLINQRQSLQKWQNREETSQRNICLWAAVGHRLITICVWDAQMSMRPATDHFLSITALQQSTVQSNWFHLRTGNISSSSSCSHTCMYMVYEELFLMSTTYILSLSWQLFSTLLIIAYHYTFREDSIAADRRTDELSFFFHFSSFETAI